MNFGKHRWALFLAIVVGVLYLIPQLFFVFSLGDDFQGVYHTLNDDELYYMARAQEVVDGHYLISNPYLAEYKDGLPMQVFLPDVIVTLPAKIFNIAVPRLFQFYDFLFPLILYLLTYFIFYQVIKCRFWSLIFTSFLFLVKYFFEFNRPINPQFVFIFVLTLILLLLMILYRYQTVNKKINLLVVLAGINFGFLFNFYTYFWTYFSTIIFLLLVYLLLRKDFYYFKKVLGVFLIGLVIGLPYFYQVWQASKLIFFQETITRIGLISTHLPSGITISFLSITVSFLFLVYWYFTIKKGEKISNTEAFLFLGTLSSIINMNQHIITGKNMFFSSHYNMISFFFIIFSFVYLLWQSKKIVFFTKLRLIELIVLLAVIVNLFLALNTFLKFDYDFELNSQRYALIFNWLNTNTLKDSVVMTNSELSSYIPAYTHNNVFFDFGGVLFFVSDEEILDRFVLNNFWQKDFNGEFIKENFRSVYGYQYDAQGGRVKQKNKIKKIFHLPEEDLEKVYFPPDKVKVVSNYYHNKTEKDWIMAFEKYQINYVIIDEIASDWQVDLNSFDFLQLVYEINQIKVYQVVYFTK